MCNLLVLCIIFTIQPLTCLKKIDLRGSKNLKEIPDLSLATNLETLNLRYCSSLVEIPSSIRNLNKLVDLSVTQCTKLEILPTGINIDSLYRLELKECSRLRSFPDFSRNMSKLYLDQTTIDEMKTKKHLKVGQVCVF